MIVVAQRVREASVTVEGEVVGRIEGGLLLLACALSDDTEEEVAWAVRRDDEALRRLLDATLSQWKQEGAVEPIVQRWIPVRVTQR